MGSPVAEEDDFSFPPLVLSLPRSVFPAVSSRDSCPVRREFPSAPSPAQATPCFSGWGTSAARLCPRARAGPVVLPERDNLDLIFLARRRRRMPKSFLIQRGELEEVEEEDGGED